MPSALSDYYLDRLCRARSQHRPEPRTISVSQIVAVVTARIFYQIILMIIFRAVEFFRGGNLGDDRALPPAGFLHLVLHFLGGGFLLRRMVKNRGAVLRPH